MLRLLWLMGLCPVVLLTILNSTYHMYQVLVVHPELLIRIRRLLLLQLEHRQWQLNQCSSSGILNRSLDTLHPNNPAKWLILQQPGPLLCSIRECHRSARLPWHRPMEWGWV